MSGRDRRGGLQVNEMTVEYGRGASAVRVLEQVSLEIEPGKVLGIAGESGCGKSTLGLSVLGTLPNGGHRVSGSSVVSGADLWSLTPRNRRRAWGTDIAHVPQGAARSLSPSLRLDRHLRDVLHRLGVREVEAKLPELLERVGLDTVPDLWARYPHQLSGGQQQRFCLALALVARPTVLVLDEPTSSLDASTQSQVAKVIRDVADRNETAVLFVSHDLGLIASVADQISVMYAGEVVEAMPRSALAAPRHPYTRALLRSNPRVSDARLPVGLPGVPPGRVLLDECAFHTRCTHAVQVCRDSRPSATSVVAGHVVRCFEWERSSNLSIARTTGWQTTLPGALVARPFCRQTGSGSDSPALATMRSTT